MVDDAQALKQLIREHIEEIDRLVEMGCERALVTGTCGVRVVVDPGGQAIVEVTPEVPYGHIHFYPAGRDA